MTASSATVAAHFNDLEQQHSASILGMWAFIAAEIMLFGALFAAYAVYRTVYPAGFADATLYFDTRLHGLLPSAVLLTSSLTMGLAVLSVRTGAGNAGLYLVATAALGLVFLLLIVLVQLGPAAANNLIPGSTFNYSGPQAKPGQIFFALYWVIVGLHALHVAAGVLMTILAYMRRRRYSPAYYTPVETTALYWHFFTVVWLFILPAIYLVNRF